MNKNYSYFIIVSFLYFFLRAFSEILLNTDELLFNYYAERLTEVQIKKIFSFQNKFKPISYLIAPILLLVKIALTSAILDIGCFFFSKDIKYKKLFNIVL